MNLTEPGNAEEITQLGKLFEDRWAAQDKHDKLMASYLTMTNEVDVAKSKDSKKGVKGFRTGIGGVIVEEDASLLVSQPQILFNAPDPESRADLERINSLLEPWAIGAWKQSQQAADVWRHLALQLIGFSRAWDNILPHPHLWATPEMEEMVKRLNDSTDHESRTKIERQIRQAKTNIWPIRWTIVPTRKTYTDYDTEYRLPEVIESREMTPRAIVNRWGEDALPGPLKDRRKGVWPLRTEDSSKIKVYVWANHQHTAVVIPHSEDPKLVAAFEHGFGRSPYECAIEKVLVENDLGIMFPGALFYVSNTIDAYDELFSDYRELHRDHARTERVWSLDRDHYDEGQLVDGRPAPIPIQDGMSKWSDETVELFPLPVIGEEKYAYLNKMEDLIRETQRRPALRGQLLSGQSQNAFSAAVQIAERELEPATKALARHAEFVVHRLFASVENLGEDVPLFDELKGKGMIAVGPKDVKGMKYAVQARISRAIPIDAGQLASVAERWKGLGFSMSTIMEQILNVGDAALESRKSKKERLEEAIFKEIAIPATLQRLQQPEPFTPAQTTEIENLLGSASPDLSQFIEGQFGDQLPGQSRQIIANQRRAGVPQNTQQPQEVTGGPPVAF